MMVDYESEVTSEKKRIKALGFFTYGMLLAMLIFLLILHLFNLYQLNTDKFAFFLVSLLTAIMLLPLVTYVKFFNIIEVRKDTRIMEKQANEKKR